MMRVTNVEWRGMTGFDLAEVERVAGVVHPGYFESREVLAERQALYRDGAYVLEVGEKISGYVLSHPWRFGEAPALNALVGSLPENPDTYYIHDIALMPLTRKVGAASQMINGLIKHAIAGGYPSISLIAVNNSVPFWSKFGFAVEQVDGLVQKLQTYDSHARYMVRWIGRDEVTAPRALRYPEDD